MCWLEAVEPDELIMEDDFQLEDAMMAIDVGRFKSFEA